MSANDEGTPTRWQRFKRGLGPAGFVIFGVVLPLITLVVEMVTGMCADGLNIDPIPTVPHIVAVALVPLVFLGWLVARRNEDVATPAWRLAMGLVTGISIVYAIPFAPIVPFALIGVFFGIGFLPLAPLFSAICGLVALFKMGRQVNWKGWWGSVGVVVGFGVLTVLALPAIQLDRAMERLDSDDPAERAAAVVALREVDPAVVEQRLCEYRRKSTPNPISPFANVFDGNYNNVSPETFWRVTGQACPEQWWSRGSQSIVTVDDRPGLSVASSRIDSSVDTVAATAYTEWLYEVHNESTWQREADFIVQLPPGAVVSRVTLWVNGEPREATFAGRGKAEAAYQAVVNRSRDPILVTSVAPDRVRVRMFPVPAGATMRARIGVSQPLELEADGNARMQFPHVVSGNVDITASHDVWVEAKHAISTAQLEGFREQEVDGVFQVRGAVEQADLGAFEVDMERAPSSQVWASDNEHWVVQKAGLLEPQRVQHLVVVVDGSAGMSDSAERLGEAFDRVEADRLTLIIAGDELLVPVDDQPLAEARGAVREFLGDFEFEGGRDNVPALSEAYRRMGDDTTVVWLHSAQPVMIGTLLTVPERDAFTIYELQVDGDRDINVDTLHAAGVLEAIPRRGTPAEDLGVWFAERSVPTWRTERQFALEAPVHGKETSRHLARIAANEMVFELMRAGEHDKAVEMAARYQIVTPVSAAIVLETQSQYDEFGLERANGEGVPSIPEPHEWALMIIGTLALAGAVWKSRNESATQMVGA